MKKISIALITIIAILLMGTSATATNNNIKAWVCKYVGTPGVDETLKNGNDGLVWVNETATEGTWFNDAHGRSFVLRYDTHANRPDPSECPGYVPPVDPPVDPPIDPPKPPPVDPPVTPPVTPPVNPVPFVAPEPQGPGDIYAPKASFGPICGDPRVKWTLDNSLSTVPTKFKVTLFSGKTGERVVIFRTVAPGKVFTSQWRWVKGKGSLIRIRGSHLELLASLKVTRGEPWGSGTCQK